MKLCAIFCVVFALAMSCPAQGPVFTSSDLWTIVYEDLSDVLRKCPGLYPVDYGTLGSPILFRPWAMNPWHLRVHRDGIPQSRIGDGLYDSNLQPAAELEEIRYDFLRGPLGALQLTTRTIPVDSPYTELQIREGYYGYGTVDFAHAQRVYRSLTLEMTGRLAWYNGLRSGTASRFNRVRGRLGVNLNPRWRCDVTYGGSHVDAESPLHSDGPYNEREEAILHVAESDSLRSAFAPGLAVYVRQDRERWGQSFRSREFTRGWVFEGHARLPRQSLLIRHEGAVATIDFPGMVRNRAVIAEVGIVDSVDLHAAGVRLGAGVRRESYWRGSRESPPEILADVSAVVTTRPRWNLYLFGGLQYAGQSVPMAWREGSYWLGDRPLNVDAAFGNLSSKYSGAGSALSPDRFRKSALGVGWGRGRSYARVQAMLLDPLGWENEFAAQGDSVVLQRRGLDHPDWQAGLSADLSVPLGWGLRLDSWWFSRDVPDDHIDPENRGFTRLYFERSFFSSPLVIRSHISHEHIGTRVGFSDRGSMTLKAAELIGFRLSATIRGVTLMWGTENFFKWHYELTPGYPMIAKEEYLAFIWRLWL